MRHLSQNEKKNNQAKVNSNPVLLRRLLAATLSVSGAWQLLPPLVSAQTVPLTAAGQPISNTATGTYVDPNDPTKLLNATSNTVTVTVAEVAGITVVGNGINDSSPTTPVLPSDVLTYSFLITNVGNDTTTVKIPVPVVTGPATPGVVTYDVDLNGNGILTDAGDFIGTTLTNAELAILQVGGTIKVNVPVTVDLSATSGAPIKVQLGDTAPNDNSTGTQNQPSTNLATDLRTVDTATGETNGLLLATAEREASAVQTILVGATPQAFAAVLKTRSATTPPVPVSNFDAVLVPYNLSLKVDSAAPAGSSASLTPTDLVGTTIKVVGINSGNAITTVLVSDAIPAGTTLNEAPSAPSGWTVVYSTVAITASSNPLADATAWTTTAPSFPDTTGTVKRVGFVKNLDGATTATLAIPKGTTVSGFTFTVKTTGLSGTDGGNVYNIAQLFGASVGGGTTVVYDESGDKTPSNFNDDGSVGPLPTNGVAVPATDGIDNAGNNTGTGTGGEDNSLVLAPAGTLLNGPLNSPAAVGPTGTNDDFTNKSSDVPAGLAPDATIPSTFNPDPVTFTNTLNAPTTALTNVLVRPVVPTDATGTPTPDVLPVGTLVTLQYGSQIAVYEYQLNSGAKSFVFVTTDGVLTSNSPIQIPTIPGNSSVDYTVKVNLPANTGLSTDALVNRGYPVPILAFSDIGGGVGGVAGDGVFNGTESNNKTIDRVYTGYLRLLKKSRVLLGTGIAVLPADVSFTTTTKTPSPGNIIEYAIEYTNISTAAVGSGNVILNAGNVVITEDGTGSSAGSTSNNWGKVAPSGVIFTSHVVTRAIDSGTSSVITFFADSAGTTSVTEQTGTNQLTDITKYVNTLAVPVAPQETRTFSFQRKLN